MKLIIDIPKDIYNEIQSLDEYEVCIAEDMVIRDGTPIGLCKDCKYFEYDSVAKVDGVPLIVAHEICNKWGNGCKSNENGYCHLFEEKEGE